MFRKFLLIGLPILTRLKTPEGAHVETAYVLLFVFAFSVLDAAAPPFLYKADHFLKLPNMFVLELTIAGGTLTSVSCTGGVAASGAISITVSICIILTCTIWVVVVLCALIWPLHANMLAERPVKVLFKHFPYAIKILKSRAKKKGLDWDLVLGKLAELNSSHEVFKLVKNPKAYLDNTMIHFCSHERQVYDRHLVFGFPSVFGVLTWWLPSLPALGCFGVQHEKKAGREQPDKAPDSEPRNKMHVPAAKFLVACPSTFTVLVDVVKGWVPPSLGCFGGHEKGSPKSEKKAQMSKQVPVALHSVQPQGEQRRKWTRRTSGEKATGKNDKRRTTVSAAPPPAISPSLEGGASSGICEPTNSEIDAAKARPVPQDRLLEMLEADV
jgi:hypothetical protein